MNALIVSTLVLLALIQSEEQTEVEMTEPIDRSEKYCVFDVTRYVLFQQGIENPESREIKELEDRWQASLHEMRLALESEGMQVSTYKLTKTPSESLIRQLNSVGRPGFQCVLRFESPNDIGHVCVVESASSGQLYLLEPATGERWLTTITHLLTLPHSSYLLFVRDRPKGEGGSFDNDPLPLVCPLKA